MKILMVISEAPPLKSGVARVADRLSTGLRSQGHTVDILSQEDIPRREWGEVRLSSMAFKLKELRERFGSYDLIHLHGPVPTFSDVFLLWGLRGLGPNRPKLVYTYHAPIDLRGPIWTLPSWAYNSVQGWLAQFADRVVVSSAAYRNHLARHVPAEKLSVIPWGVDFNRFYAPVEKRGPFTVLYMGQVRPYKGLPVLLNAAAGLEGMRLWVVGRGHSIQACERQAKELQIKNATFWGSPDDLEATGIMRQAHVIVLPSVTRSEAFGIVLLEGMAAGLVPVASHLPGVADVVGTEGFTFTPGSSRALREVLLRMRDDRELRVHIAGLAQQKARLYSWERTVYRYDHLFRSVVSGNAVWATPRELAA